MRLKNSRYEEIKQEVADLLQTYNVSSYPIDLYKLTRKMRIPLIEYSSFEKEIFISNKSKSEDSFLAIVKNRPHILFNDSQNRRRYRFSIAHEIGHIWLEHKEDTKENEAEANFFAAYLLVPVPLIIKYEISESARISSLFDVSSRVGDYSLSRATKRLKIDKPQTEYEYSIINLCLLKGDV